MQPTRIRLEGRLETVEQTVEELERGLGAARDLNFAPLSTALARQQSREVQDACEQVNKLSAEDPKLARTLKRLWKLVHAAEQRVMKRARKLKLTPAPIAETVRELIDDPVIYGRRPDRRWILYAMFIASIAGTFMWSHFRMGIWPLFVVMFAASKLAPIDVLVTRRRLVLGDVTVPIADVKHIALARSGGRFRHKNFKLTVELTNGERRTHELAEPAPQLVEALKSRGLVVDVSR